MYDLIIVVWYNVGAKKGVCWNGGANFCAISTECAKTLVKQDLGQTRYWSRETFLVFTMIPGKDVTRLS